MSEKNTFYDDVMSKTYESVRTRTLLRFKHLEKDGWRKISDILTARDYAYGGDIYMLNSYLNNRPETVDMTTLQPFIEENISNPEINWSAILSYLDDRIHTEKDWEYAYTLEEIIKIINQYKDQMPNEYSGFVLY